MSFVLGIDNGSTGSIGVFNRAGTFFTSIPGKDGCHTKTGKIYRRVDVDALKLYICNLFPDDPAIPATAYIERPFTGSAMMIAVTVLAARSHEAVTIAMEQLGIGYTTVDSKEWQAAMLPGVKGSADLKRASKLKGLQLYPALKPYIDAHGDADGLLMAKYYSRT